MLSAPLRLGGHGFAVGDDSVLCSPADRVGQARTLAKATNPILQIVPETYTQFSASLLQTGKSVSAAAACLVPRAPADLAAFIVFAAVREKGVGNLKFRLPTQLFFPENQVRRQVDFIKQHCTWDVWADQWLRSLIC